eukprot:jgi/Chrzof1/3528/Cz12g28220.t1
MAVHASITLISQHGLSSHYYCMCYYVISVMHYISNASAVHHSSAGYARQCAPPPTASQLWPATASRRDSMSEGQ